MTDKKRSQKLLKQKDLSITYQQLELIGSNKLDYKEINKNVKSIKMSCSCFIGFGIKSKKDVIDISKNKCRWCYNWSAQSKYFDIKMDLTST